MKVIFAPDSFKGALTAPDAADAMATGWRRVFPTTECVCLPIADGGEGTCAALIAASGGQLLTETVTGPLGEPVTAQWGLLPDGTTAVIELAQAAGLTQVPVEKRDPKITTTYGVGELIRIAASRPGIRKLIIGLGGSATNDGGAGILQVLGVRLLDEAGQDLPFGGAALTHLTHLDATNALDLPHLTVEIACDVDNPLTGPRGASAVFGPQKGAKPEEVALLDAALERFVGVLGFRPALTPGPSPNAGRGESHGSVPTPEPEPPTGNSDSPLSQHWERGAGGVRAGNPLANVTFPGAGAAGGTPVALKYLFPNAALKPGIELVLDAVNFDEHLTGATLVLTGEGRLDAQTLGGKAIHGIAQRARAKNVPVGAIIGSIAPELSLSDFTDKVGVAAVLPLAPGPCTLAESMANAKNWLADATERAARWFALGKAFSTNDTHATAGNGDNGG